MAMVMDSQQASGTSLIRTSLTGTSLIGTSLTGTTLGTSLTVRALVLTVRGVDPWISRI
jgi:hypothetical protein